MKKLYFITICFALAILIPRTTMGEVDVHINIGLPPPIVFPAPPGLVVIPETYVYAAPDIDVDIFFYNGWWWRPWEGRWYRSRNYNSGWSHYRNVPSFYKKVPPGWRNHYRNNHWEGRQWRHEPIPHQKVERNWRNWEKSRHWEKKNNWGVKGLKPKTHYKPQSRDVRPQHSQPQQWKGQQQNKHGHGGKMKD